MVLGGVFLIVFGIGLIFWILAIIDYAIKKEQMIFVTIDELRKGTEKKPASSMKILLILAGVLIGGYILCTVFTAFSSAIQGLGLSSEDNTSNERPGQTRDVIRFDNGVIEHLNTLTDLQNETSDLIINSKGDLSPHSKTILRIGTDMGISISKYRRLEVPPERADLDRIINNYNAKVTAAHDALLDYAYSGSNERYEILEQIRDERVRYWENIIQPAIKEMEAEYD